MYSKATITLGCAALAMSLGCAVAPQPAIDDANVALESARTAEAEEYAPAAWQLAEDALESAMSEVQVQNEKFALFRSYEAAAQLLEKATQNANAAATEATSAREEAKARAMARIEEAQAALDAARTALETAPKGKGTEADLAIMKAEIDAMASSLEAATQAYVEGRFRSSESTAQALTDQANAMTADIAQAAAKTKRRTT